MPYAPGIQNISGELLAQGMRERSQGVAGGLVNWIKGYEQNQALKNQGVAAFSGLLGSDPDFQAYVNNVASGNVQVPAAVSKAIKNYQNGDIDVYDAAILGNTGQAFSKHKSDVVQRQAMQAQAAGHAAKALGDIADLGFYAQQPGSTISPEAVQSLQQFIGQTVGQRPQAGMAAPQPGMTALDQFVRRQAAAPAPVAAPQGIQQFAGEPTAEAQPQPELPEGAIQTGRRSREAQMQEARQAVSQLSPTQQRRSLNTVLADIQKRDLDLSKNISFNDPAKAAAYAQQLNAQSKTPGIKFVVDTDPRTGYNIVKQVTSTTESPEEAARRKRLEVGAELDAKGADEYIKQVQKEGAGAMDDTFINQEIRKALNSKVETGPVEAFKQSVRKIAIGAGLADQKTIDEANRFDELEGLMMRGQLEFAQNFTRGNLNTFEQKLVESAVQNARNKLPGANAYLNDVVEAIKQKKADLANAEKEFRSQYKDKVDRAQALRDWELDPANSVNKRFQQLRASSAATSAVPATTGVKPPSGWTVSP